MRGKFSEDQWFIISSTPTFIGSTMAMVGDSGVIGSIKEVLANGKALAAGGEKYPSNPLIHSIVLEAKLNQPETQNNAETHRDKMIAVVKDQEIDNREKMIEFSIQNLKHTLRLIEDVAYQKDIDEFKQWIFEIGQTIAEAAKEGGILSIGGERVSTAEKEFLTQIQAAIE